MGDKIVVELAEDFKGEVTEQVLIDKIIYVMSCLPDTVPPEDIEIIKDDLSSALYDILDSKSKGVKPEDRIAKQIEINDNVSKIETYVNMREFQNWTETEDYDKVGVSVSEHIKSFMNPDEK